MDDNPLDVRDNDINVEEIMKKIRKNIRNRQVAGQLPPDSNTFIAPLKCSGNDLDIGDSFQQDLAYLNTYWDIQNNSYFISSHRPFMGRILVKGRTLIHGEVRRYMDPIINKQCGFNKSTVRILNNLAQDAEKNNETISKFINSNDKALSQLEAKQETRIREEALRVISVIHTDIEQKIHLDVQSAISAINSDIQRKMEMIQSLEDRILSVEIKKTTDVDSSGVAGISYLSFENQFRGSREDISERQKKFIGYFTNCSNVLDIGCGRGEFLELLHELGIGVRGVDIDESMVEFCRTKGLDVEMADAVTCLERVKDQSLDGIFIDQVVEHLEPSYLVKLLGLCYQKMKEGHCIVIETINPTSFASLANFYIDMTHKHPVHPETLKYLINSCGFKDVEVQFSSPIPKQARLHYMPDIGSDNSEKKERIMNYNRNIEVLNSVLFGPQDYIVVGKR